MISEAEIKSYQEYESNANILKNSLKSFISGFGITIWNKNDKTIRIYPVRIYNVTIIKENDNYRLKGKLSIKIEIPTGMFFTDIQINNLDIFDEKKQYKIINQLTTSLNMSNMNLTHDIDFESKMMSKEYNDLKNVLKNEKTTVNFTTNITGHYILEGKLLVFIDTVRKNSFDRNIVSSIVLPIKLPN